MPATGDIDGRIARHVRTLLLITALLYAVLFVYVAYTRILYPQEIKWMEGGILDQVLRVLEGRHIYAEPSWQFASYLYTPLYYYLSAAVSFFSGENFVAMRLVSTASSLLTALLIGLIVHREAGSRTAAWIAGCAFLAATRFTDFYLDAGRADPLFLALALSYVWFARYHLTLAGQLTAAVLGTLALLTKQTAVIACVPIALFMFASMRGGIRYIVPVTGVTLASLALLTLYISSDGWFAYYAFELPSEHRYQWEIFPRLLYSQFLTNYAGVILLAIAAVALAPADWWRRQTFASLLFLTLAAAAFLPYMHTGSAPNVLLPLQAGCAILLGISLAKLEQHRGYVIALVVAWLQFAAFFYLPADTLPNRINENRAKQLVACMAAFPKPVLNTRTGFLWRQAGTEPAIHEPAAADIFRTGASEENAAMRAALAERVQSQYYSALFLGPQLRTELEPLLLDSYQYAGFNFTTELPGGDFNGYMAAFVFLSNEFVAEYGLPDRPVCEMPGFDGTSASRLQPDE